MEEPAALEADFHLQFYPLLLLRLLHLSLESYCLMRRSQRIRFGVVLKEALTAPKRWGCSPLRTSPGWIQN